MASTSLWFVLLANSGDPSQLQSCQSFLPTTMHALRTDKCFKGVSGQYFQATCSGSVASLKTYTSATCASNALVQTEGFTVGCSSVSPNATVASKVLCQGTSKVTEPPVDYLDYVYYK